MFYPPRFSFRRKDNGHCLVAVFNFPVIQSRCLCGFEMKSKKTDRIGYRNTDDKNEKKEKKVNYYARNRFVIHTQHQQQQVRLGKKPAGNHFNFVCSDQKKRLCDKDKKKHGE